MLLVEQSNYSEGIICQSQEGTPGDGGNESITNVVRT